MRIAIIERDKCTHKKCGYRCVSVCPGVRMGDETVKVGDDGYPIIDETLCTGCGICPKKCPSKCIRIINIAEEKGSPVFQYGSNAFRLYGLPLPQEGVVGLIGKNGIGKTTAIRLLSGSITPNFGEYKRKWKIAEALGRMGVEAKAYFSKLAEKKVRVSYKPQNVNLLQGAFKGNVGGLLKKMDERNAIDEAVRIFELEESLGKKMGELSGGELQRAAIAAAWLKDADIYYFDEPASYLDIAQRLKMGRALKELSERKNVIVVEHDLAIFDYLSDYIYVLYGEENAYGILSGLKNARAGINEYLQGYLREENVRFRNNAITFEQTALTERKSPPKVSFSPMKKDLPGFSFESEEGEIKEGEIMGIVGKNAIGKTLFIKMLAGVEKPDEGEGGIGLKLSYKPQYIRAEGGIVSELFSSSKMDGAVLEEAKRILSMGPLMEREVKHLSGGELQRVAITLALSRNADIYLFDEPSAFLDVEQRMHFASLLKRIIENSDKAAFVVDHDVVLIDAISNRLMVFDGVPSVHGKANKAESKRDGMNRFLRSVGITMRRDKDTLRPRINKPDSALDREQKEKGEHFYYVKD